jgi:hypothetical protein
MKSLFSLLALGFAVATITPAYADKPAPTTQEECQKTPDYEWDADQGKCVEQSPGG